MSTWSLRINAQLITVIKWFIFNLEKNILLPVQYEGSFQGHYLLDEWKDHLLELCRLKQVRTRMSVISRYTALIYWALCLDMLSPSMVWWVPGCTLKGVHPPPSTLENNINIHLIFICWQISFGIFWGELGRDEKNSRHASCNYIQAVLPR
jgi:hypothetical protein